MPAILPTAILPGYEVLAAGAATPSQGIFIPLASLVGLTAGEADEATGDGRKVAFELSRTIFTNYTAIATANRPAKFSITRGTPAGVDASTVRQSYTYTFDLDVSASDMSSEPA